VAVAHEDLVLLFEHLDVEIAGGAAAGADLALGREADAHPVADTGGHLDGDLAAGTHAAVAAALAAGIRDRLADTAAGGARPGRHDLAEERTLDGLDLTGTAARLAAHGLRVS